MVEPTVPETAEDVAAKPGGTVGRFTLESVLGAGGMGIVFVARDPVLDRKVAVKLIRGGSEQAEVRLLREAQALAKLKHPNVVTVHEAGTAGDQVFIAMELVEGTNLREWLATERTTRAIVDTFLAAGRGLAAAHAAKLVHRDFKPANVFVDRAGAVKVGDFGLVGATAGDAGAASPLDRSVTTTGNVMGTPAYMAPEQLRGELVDARADQYAYCKSVLEALVKRGVPRRVRAVIERGLAEDPAERYAGMPELLADLERAVRAPRRMQLAVAGVAVAALATTATVFAMGGREDTCAAVDPLAGLWDATRIASLRDKLARDPAGANRFEKVRGPLNAYALELEKAMSVACRANRSGEQSDLLYERRVQCLNRRRDELANAIAALEGAADRPALDAAVTSALSLVPLAACTDDNALLSALPPPDDPQVRQAVDAVQAEIDAIEAGRRASRNETLLDRATAAVEAARTTKHLPIISAALKQRAELLLERERDAVASLAELAQIAAKANDAATEAWAYGELMKTLGNNHGKPGEGLALVTAARAALTRAGDRIDLKINFHYNHAAVLITNKQAKEALAELAEGKRLLIAAGADQPGSPLTHRLATYEYGEGTIRAKSGDLAGSEAPLRRSIVLWKQAFGDDHPDVAWGYDTLAEVLRQQDKIDDALGPYRDAIRIREARIPDSSTLAQSLYSTGYTLMRAGKLAEAQPMIERSIAILTKRGAKIELGAAQMVLGLLHVARKQYAEARTTYDAAIATLESTGSTADANLPLTLWNRGDLAVKQEQFERALPDFTRALELFVAIKGKDHPYVGNTLVVRGRVFVRLKRYADAIADLDAALANAQLPAAIKLQATYVRGWALVESNRDRAGGMAAVRAARAELVKSGQTAEVAEIDAWLVGK